MQRLMWGLICMAIMMHSCQTACLSVNRWYRKFDIIRCHDRCDTGESYTICLLHGTITDGQFDIIIESNLKSSDVAMFFLVVRNFHGGGTCDMGNGRNSAERSIR